VVNRKKIFNKLNNLLETAPEIEMDDEDRFVIFSDLHIGGRRSRDDFLPNSAIFMTALEEYYLKKDYTLILNGDIEELQRVRLKTIRKKWPDLYELFGKFKEDHRLYKIIGNHDWDLLIHKYNNHFGKDDINYDLLPALKLKYKKDTLFIIHGHQVQFKGQLMHMLNTFALRFLVNPLGIPNINRHYSSDNKLKAEVVLYDYSRKKEITTLVGHTHRALFEGRSMSEYLRFNIDRLIRQYILSESEVRDDLVRDIHQSRDVLEEILSDPDHYGSQSNTYDLLEVPSLFNSGAVANKYGVTGLEISRGRISLVVWFDLSRDTEKSAYLTNQKVQIPGTTICRAVLKEDSLDYIFTRHHLLA